MSGGSIHTRTKKGAFRETPATTDTPMDASRGEQLARRFHDSYERLAPSFGYETRKDTRAFDPTTPNGRLMIAVCQELIKSGEVFFTPKRSASNG